MNGNGSPERREGRLFEAFCLNKRVWFLSCFTEHTCVEGADAVLISCLSHSSLAAWQLLKSTRDKAAVSVG